MFILYKQSRQDESNIAKFQRRFAVGLALLRITYRSTGRGDAAGNI